MKRVLIAGLLAVGIHGLLLGMECGGLKKRFFDKPRHQHISMTLAIRQPQVPAKEEKDKPFAAPEKRPFDTPKPPKKKRTPRAKKPEIQKLQKPSVQPKEKPIPKVLPQTTPAPLNGIASDDMIRVPQTATTETTRSPVKQTIIEARPLYRINPPPKYPAMARRRGYAGQVVLEVLVGRNGNVIDLRLFASSGHDILDNAAVDSVKTWIFEPGMKGDETVEMWVRVPIRFELK